MVSMRFTSFVLVLMFILLHGRDSIAHSPQDGNGPVAVRVSPAVTVEKEIYGGVPVAIEFTKKRLGGRKMILKKPLGEEEAKEESSSNGEASKKTGNDASALKKLLGTSQEHMNDQNERRMLKEKSLNSASPETSVKRPVDLPNTDQLQPCSQKPDDDDDDDPFQNLEAANEMVNLMNKDYGGHQTTPPIHNAHPLNQQLGIP